MKKLYIVILFTTVLFLNACNSASIKARDHLYGYLQADALDIDVYSQEDGRFDDVVYGGFSNYGYVDDEHLELIYIRENTYSEVNYYFDYQASSPDNIELTIESVELIYQNIDTDEYLRIEQKNLNDYYQFTEDGFDEFIVMLYELRLIDIEWILSSMGYELGSVR